MVLPNGLAPWFCLMVLPNGFAGDGPPAPLQNIGGTISRFVA
jgi:hypothetical protein